MKGLAKERTTFLVAGPPPPGAKSSRESSPFSASRISAAVDPASLRAKFHAKLFSPGAVNANSRSWSDDSLLKEEEFGLVLPHTVTLHVTVSYTCCKSLPLPTWKSFSYELHRHYTLLGRVFSFLLSTREEVSERRRFQVILVRAVATRWVVHRRTANSMRPTTVAN